MTPEENKALVRKFYEEIPRINAPSRAVLSPLRRLRRYVRIAVASRLVR
jgi:hypothetical protein